MSAEPPPVIRSDTQVFPRVLAALVVVGLMIGAGVATALLVFGGDDGGDTRIGEYLAQTNTVLTDMSDRSGVAEVESADAILPAWAAIVEDAVEQLQAIEPPPEASDAHDRLAGALTAGQEAFLALSQQEGSFETQDDVSTALAGDEAVQAAQQDAAAACRELQQLADEREVDVTFDLCAPAAAPAATPPAGDEASPEPTGDAGPTEEQPEEG